MKQKQKKIIVVGAGLAGLSASKNLIDAGYRVELLESRQIAGGKVSAWQDKDGDWIESGLHVFFGSYQRIFDLMKDVGIYENIHWQTPSIQYCLPEGERFQIISNEYLPCPLNLLPNFFFSHKFTITDLWRYCLALMPVLRKDLAYIHAQDELSFVSWVQQFDISDSMIQRMFLPMTLSLKFLPVSQISAQVVLNVFRLFITNPKGFKIGFLKGSPTEKLTGPILEYLQQRGVKVHYGAKVQELQRNDKNLEAVITSTGERFTADGFVFALPTHKFKKVLSPVFPELPFFQNLHKFEGVPVANAQFWLDQPLMDDKRLHFGTHSITPVFADMQPYYNQTMLETVIAPMAEIQEYDDEAILDLAWKQLQSYYPQTKDQVKVRKSSLVRIPQSVYAPYPGLEEHRPSQQTPIPNLFLAGGFTRGHEFFDSMEGAVQSGYLAAKAVKEELILQH